MARFPGGPGDQVGPGGFGFGRRDRARRLALQIDADRARTQRFPVARPVAVARQRPFDGGFLESGRHQVPVDTELEWPEVLPIETGRVGFDQRRQRGRRRERERRGIGNNGTWVGHGKFQRSHRLKVWTVMAIVALS